MNFKKLLFVLLMIVLQTINTNAQVTLTQTNLPIIIINTNGNLIGSAQIQSDLTIINNASGLNTPTDLAAYSGKIGINLRGSSGNPKESYNVETWTNLIGVSLDTALLGMPSDNDWVLIANYTDRSLMRDLIGFHIYEEMGYYASRMRLCEVILNNNYQGVYLFGEKIKRGVNRLDISKLKLTDASGTQLTGGYIFKIESSNAGYWTSNYAPPHASAAQDIKFHYDEPKTSNITPVQKDYIRKYVDSFETALQGAGYQDTTTGWRGYAGHKAFEDYFIFNELLKSSDAYRVGTYLYKDKGKKLRIGPPWDLELGLYNTADCNSSLDTGWAYQYGIFCGTQEYLPPFWWEKLVTDTLFMRETKCRYTNLRQTVLDTANMFHLMDSISSILNVQQAQGRNFQQWPVFGVALVNEPVLAATYAEEVDNIKGFIRRRLQFLDSKWLTTGCPVTGVGEIVSADANVIIYPNPTTETFLANLQLEKAAEVSISVKDLMGRTVLNRHYGKLPAGNHLLSNSLGGINTGVYTVIVSVNMEQKAIRLLKQ